MATIVNDRDVLLQAATTRTTNDANADILLVPAAPAFHLTANGTSTVPSITVKATRIALEGAITFSVQNATLSNVTADSADVAYASVTGPTVIVTATVTSGGHVYTKNCILTTLQDGAIGVDGARGAGSYYSAGSAWTDAAAEAATPGDTVVGDQVTISNGTSFTLTKRWNGTAWVVPGAYLSGDLFVDGAIQGSKIKAGSLELTDASGHVFLKAGSTLDPAYAPAGTLNSDLMPAINSAASTANWGSIASRPADTELLNSAIQIGGRNLYKKTTRIDDSADGSRVTGRYADGFDLFGIVANTGMIRMYNVIPKNGTYTLSFDLAIGSGTFPLGIDVCDNATQTITLSQTVTRYSLTFTVANWSADTYNFIDFNGLSGQYYQFRNFMLVEGNKGMSWTPAPEDVQAGIDSAATMATGVTLSSTGTLSGGGASGSLQTVPVLDRARSENWPPSSYPMGTTREFKQSVAIGLNEADGFWCTLETIKQYMENATGYPGYQYVYQGAKTFRRQATSDAGTAWTAWVQDLDRNAYTGDLNASSDLVLIGSANMKIEGNTATMIGGGGWDESVYSPDGCTGGAFVSARVWVGSVMLGLNSASDLTDRGYSSIDYSIYAEGGGATSGALYMWSQAGQIGQIGTWTAGDIIGLTYDGTNIVWYKNGAPQGVRAVPVGQQYFLDTSFAGIGAKLTNIRFGPMSDTSAGVSAYNAIPGINTSIADKLSKTSASILRAPITLTTSGGIVVGSLTFDPTNGLRTGGTGVAVTPYGIVGHDGSKYTFAVSAVDGSAQFGGQLTAAYGTFGAVDIAAGGYVKSGQSGYHSGVGFFLGQSGGVPKLSIGNPGVSSLRWDGSNIIIENPQTTQTPLTVSLSTTSGSTVSSYGKTTPSASTQTAIPTITGGSGNYSYTWTASSTYAVAVSAPTGANTFVSMKGPGTITDVDIYVVCSVKDNTTGKTGQAVITFTLSFT